jgi:hypothetical protein
MARPDSYWDIGLYYRGSIDSDAIHELGYAGHVTEPGAWGRIVNGGAWLQVEHWIGEADAGRFEIDRVGGHIAGLPTYVLAGELALGTVLRGSLPRPSFAAALRRAAPPRWEGDAAFSLLVAEQHGLRGDAAGCAELLARAVMAAAHARLAGHGTWALSEKGLVSRAGLDEAAEILASVGWTPQRLQDSVARMRHLLRLEWPLDLVLDEVVRTDEAAS